MLDIYGSATLSLSFYYTLLIIVKVYFVANVIVCSDDRYLNELDGSGGCLLFTLITVALMTIKQTKGAKVFLYQVHVNSTHSSRFQRISSE